MLATTGRLWLVFKKKTGENERSCVSRGNDAERGFSDNVAT